MFKFNPNTGVPGFRVGLPDDDKLGFNVANDGSTPPVLPGARDAPAVDDNYPFGATLPGFIAPPAPSRDPVAPLSNASPLPLAGNQMPTNPTVSAGFLPLDPRGYGGAFNYARYVPDNPINQAEPAAEPPNPIQKTSGGTDLSPIGSAQAQTPQPQQPGTSLEIDPSPGEAVVLPDGSTIADETSSTGKVMSPTADLSAVAAAGRRTGFMHRAMLINPLTAGAAPAWMVANLRANVSHGGTFDYQRRGDQFLGQFTPVSNVNVGLFAQQAGLSLDEALAIAGLYARQYSGNAKPGEPHGLHPNQLKYITAGFKIGQSGVFGAPATP
jgi:hypothetical protein